MPEFVSGSKSEEKDIHARMREFAAGAVQHASEVEGMTLDYTVQSLSVVEAILTKLQEGLPGAFWRLLGAAPNNTELAIMCEMYGGYVGEVIRAEIGGDWLVPSDGPFVHAPTIAFNGDLSSPVIKVYERITKADDTIPAYFESMRKRWSGVQE